MEKQKKQKSINKILTLMLTFVMVFTGMGIGSWGVSEAWADDTIPTIKIQKNVDGVLEVATDDDSVSIKKEPVSISVGNNEATVLYVATINEGIKYTLKNSSGLNFLKAQMKDVDGNSVGPWKKDAENAYDSELCGSLKTTEEKLKELKLDEIYTSGCGEYYFAGFNKSGSIFALLIQVKEKAQPVNKKGLAETIEEAKKIMSPSLPEYYTSADRYNGKTVSTNGFWNDMKAVLSEAETIYTKESASQEQVDEINAKLTASIDNLIPTTQINATALYEAATTEWVWTGTESDNKIEKLTEAKGANVEPINDKTCTLSTWTAYEAARSEGTKMLEKLFQDGKATTDNVNDKEGKLQAEVNALAAAADASKLVRQSAYDAAYTYYQKNKGEMELLLTQYDPARLTESDYTAESWKAYTDAYHALETTQAYRIVGGTTEDYAALSKFQGYTEYDESTLWTYHPPQLTTLKNTRAQLVSNTDIKVSFTYVNNFSARYPSFLEGGTNLYANKQLELKKGETSLTAAMTAAGLTYNKTDDNSIVGSNNNLSDTNPRFLVIVNGENYGMFAQTSLATQDIQLHDGDEVRIARIIQPIIELESSTGYDTSSYEEDVTYNEEQYRDSIAQIKMTVPQKVKVGDKASFGATVTGVNTTNKGKALSAENISLFVSEPQETDTLTEPTTKTQAKTDADGNLQYVFTKPGYYTVAMYNVTPDKLGTQNIYNEVTAGTYYSLYAGDYACIYVAPAEDEEALIKQYKAENISKAKDLYEGCHDYDFTAGYYTGDFKEAYDNLIKNQNQAASFTELMQAFETDYAALEACSLQKLDHEARVENLRTPLTYVPEDLSELNDGDKTFIKDIQDAYADLNAYEKTLLTAKEISTLDEIAKLDLEELSAQAKVTFKLIPEGDFISAADGNTGAAQYGYPNQERVYHIDLDGSKTLTSKTNYLNLSSSVWEKEVYAGDEVAIWRYLKTTDELYKPMWSADGKTWHELQQTTLKDIHGTSYPDYYITQIPIPEDAADGSEFTVTLKMVDKTTYEKMTAETPEQIEAAKTAALESLAAAYGKYKEDSYTADNWAKLKEAYDAGQDAINAATSSEAAAEARKAALAAMAAIEAKGSSSGENPGTKPSYDSGKTVGRVYITLENSTYADGAFTGKLVDGWYDLGENDNMMTCILKALDQKGYGWNGTKDFDKTNPTGDYDITYLASIEKDGKSLGEFDGSKGSGWMGTLNDWFTNEGFAAFTYKNGGIESGDEIHVMFTMNYGEDLGGTWNNNNTKLKGLTVSGGTLSPAFSGSQTEYTLMITGDKANVTVKPEAANKNYQARIFLNTYNKDSARYKTTETISVKSGDILYVGVGESGWPTMNSSASGTKYTIKVVNNSDSSAVKEMLNALKTITYSNYRAEKASVESAKAAYNALSAEAKKDVTAAELKKLTDAEAQVKFYTEIDDAKTKLNALTDSSSSSQAREALSAYNKLTDEQKKYITQADVKKFNELAAKYSLSDITGAEEMPESEVVTEGKSGSAITTSPAEVKMSGTTAAVTIKADNQKEILKQAKEKKSAQVVLTVAEADAKGAEKYELSLEKSFLQSLLKDTEAKLVVKTPMGQKTYDREALQKLVDEATTAVIKAEINKDNLDQQIEEPAADVKALTAKLTPVARSAKTAKKNVKVTVSLDKQDKEILSQLKEAGYTVKYRFYRSTKKSAGYKSTVTKKTANYTNTSGKKGTKYFYKVQVRVYDENGKLIAKTALKQCKYASRTWTKAK